MIPVSGSKTVGFRISFNIFYVITYVFNHVRKQAHQRQSAQPNTIPNYFLDNLMFKLWQQRAFQFIALLDQLALTSRFSP